MGRFFCTYFSLFLLLLLSVSEVQGQLNATFTSTDQSQCPGNLFVLNANNPTYSNYAWTIAGPNGFNSSLSGSSIVVFLNNSGYYSVTLTVSDAGFTTTNTQNNFLEVYSPPTISYTISSTSGCVPLAVNFNGSSIPGSGSFQSFAINSANGTISNTEDFSIIYSSAGIYNPTATVTNSFGCFTTMNLPAISVLPAPSLTSPLNSNIICSGSAFNYSFSSSISGTTYTWARASVPGISPNASSGLGNINEILVNNTSNNIIVPYVITSTAPNGCVGIQTINVLVRVLPTVSANTTNIDICQGQTTNLTATGSTQNGQYLWSTGEETSSIMVDASGVYSVTFNNGICTSLPLNINVNTIAAPVVNLTNSENSGLANNDAIICAGASIQLTANPVLAGGSYLWMPGNLNTQSITVSPSSSIAYTLVYSLGCPSIADTIAVLVNNLPINSYTASTSNACSAPVTTAFTSTTLNANNALTTWSFPGASSPISGIGAGPIAVTYNTSGNYSISMTTTSLDGCVSAATFPNAITVGNGAPPSSSFVNLTAGTQCVNADNFCFQYTGVGADTILLDFGNGITDFFDPTVSYCYSYPALGNYTVSMTPFTTVGNAVGCSGSTSQLNVVVTGPQAIFTISPVVCSNQLTRSFNSISAGTSPSTVYTWNFGDGSPNSSLQAVTHTFPSFGSFTVNLTVSDVLTGCLPNSYQVVVHANPNNLANFQSNLSGVLTQDVCLGTTLQFVNTTPAPQYNSGVLPASNTSNNTQWDWNTNNGIVFSTAINSLRGTPRTRIFSSPVYSPGNYGVAMLNIDNNGCRDTVIKTIQVHGVIGTFSVSDTVCTGLSFSANDNSSSPIGSIISRVWSWGDGTPNTAGNIANPTHIYAASGSYLITLTVTDDFGCTKTSTKVVVVRKPFASFNVDQDFICNNQSIVVSHNAFGVGTLNYSWSATSANPLSAVGSNPAPFTFVQQGNQTISLTVSDNLGCTDDTLIPITVLNVSAAAVASGNSFACFNPPNVVSFTNTSLNNPDINSAQWDFGNGQTSTNWNPSTVYSLPGTYNVSLVVSSMPTSSGAVCRDTQEVVIINIGGPNGSLDVTNLNLTGCSCYLASIDVNTSGATEAKLLFGNGAFVDLIPNTSQTVTYSYCNTGTTQIQFVPSLFLSNGACFGYIPSLDTIRIQPTPTVNNLANQIICANSNTNTVNFSSPVLNTSFSWTNSNPTIGLAAAGTGSISSFFAQNNTSNQQNATINVTPIANGCPGNPVTFTYSVNALATINAGIDQTICGTSTATLAGTQGGATTSVTWSGGTGTFSPNATTLNAVYTPSAAEVSTGSVTLILTSNDPTGPCSAVSDQVLITINQPATVNAGIDQTICGTAPVSLSGTQGGATTSVTWSGGTGTFSPNTTNLNSIYTASAADIAVGSVTLTLTSNNPSGPCPSATDQVLITIAQPPTVSAGIDQTICGTSTSTLAGTQGGATTSVTWSGGTGTFSPNATTLNAVYTPSAAEVSAGSVTLTLSSNDPTGPCSAVSDQVLIIINQPATVNAGIDQTICGTAPVSLSGTQGGVTTSVTWSGGTGIFSPNASTLNAIYTPSAADVAAGSVTLTLTSNNPAGACNAATDQVLITINQPASVNAGIDQTICGTSTATLSGAQGGATTLATWSGGTGNFSPNATTLNAVYTPSAAEVSAGSVTLTLTSNDPTGPCGVVSDQVLIMINQSATVNAGIDQTICGTSTVTLTGTQGGSTTSVTWSGGTGTFSPNATSLNAIYTPSAADVAAGSVTLTLTSNNPAGACNAATDQVLITINQPAAVNAGIDQSICGTSNVTLAGTQGGATTSVTWIGGTGTYSPNATTLNAVYTPSAAEVSAGSVTLTLTSNDPTGPCSAVSDQVLITINQPATVNAGIDQTICGTTPVSLSGTQGGATTSVTWIGGTGTFSPNASTLNAIYTPSAADVTAGLATLTFTSDDPIGPCAVATDQILITINALPIIVGQDTVVLCTGDNLNYTIVTDVASNVSWFGTNNPDVTGETLPVQNTSFIGDNLVNATNNIQYVIYNIDLTSLSNGCQSANQRLIAQVNPLPIIDSIGDLFYCDGVVTSPVILGSNLLNTNFLWTNSNPVIGLAASGTGDIPAFTPSNNSIADIIANITVVPESSGCLGNSFSFNITIGPIPNVNVSPAGPYCVSSPSENLVVDVVNGFWSGPGIVNQVTGEFDPSFANVGINVISYSLNGVCGGGSSIDILVYPNPEASFTADNFSTSVLDPVFHFENTSVNATAYTWNFGNGTSSTLENPTQTYPEVIGYYLVELIATNNSGCVDTVSNFVYVEEETIFYVPNSFTPDGNEVNNVFQPVFSEGYDSDFYSLRIFNRWGEVVFETTEVLEGWDGTYKGFLSPDGTYVWSISFKAATTDFVYSYEGHVTLIR